MLNDMEHDFVSAWTVFEYMGRKITLKLQDQLTHANIGHGLFAKGVDAGLAAVVSFERIEQILRHAGPDFKRDQIELEETTAGMDWKNQIKAQGLQFTDK